MRWVCIALFWCGAVLVSAAPARPDAQIRQRLDQLVSGAVTQIDGITFEAPTLMQRLYQTRNFAPIWSDALAQHLIALLTDAASQGLEPRDYFAAQLSRLPPPSHLSGWARADADLELTEAFLRYAYHCRFGKVDPNAIEADWNYGRSATPAGVLAALERILAAKDFDAQFDTEMGHGAVYDAMRAVLTRYRGYAAHGGWRRLRSGASLRAGDSGARVVALRRRLDAEDFSTQSPTSTDFDDDLGAAVRAFQRTHGLAEDGIVGPRTFDALNVPVAARIEQIRVNLERLRWVLVDRAPNFVAVNIAGFRVYYIEDDHITWSARAVVGQPYRATPVFRAEMKYLVLNPDWTVPPTILLRDVLPAMHSDPRYLAREHMEVVDYQGRPVDPAKLDWSRYPGAPFPYLIRQLPGPTNSLGRIKFMFPNSHFVFLHDTPKRALFDRPDRTFSSGCIRVEHPLDLAVILLRDNPGWDRAALDAAIAAGTTRTVFLDHPVPVLLLYLTVVAFDGGREFAFYRDVYGRDPRLGRALDAPFEYVPPHGLESLSP